MTVQNKLPQKNLQFTRKKLVFLNCFGGLVRCHYVPAIQMKKRRRTKTGGARHEGSTTESVRWLRNLSHTILQRHTGYAAQTMLRLGEWCKWQHGGFTPRKTRDRNPIVLRILFSLFVSFFGRSTRQCKIRSLKKAAIRVRKVAIPNFLGGIVR